MTLDDKRVYLLSSVREERFANLQDESLEALRRLPPESLRDRLIRLDDREVNRLLTKRIQFLADHIHAQLHSEGVPSLAGAASLS